MSSVHSGSPSKSKKMSPASGTGRSPIAAGSTTSNTSGSDEVSCRTCSAACRRRVASVAPPMPGTAAGARRQLVDRVHPGRRQPRALRRPHPGHQEHVPVRDHLRRTAVAPAARPVARVTPGHRRAPVAVRVEQALQAGAALAVQRQQVGEAVAGPGAVTQDQVHLVRHRHTGADQLVRVRRQLEQRGDLHAAGQLGVEHRPPAALAHHEVGPPREPAVEEPRLVDDVRVRGEGGERRGVHPFQRGALPGLVVPRARDRDDVVRLAVPREHRLLVRGAQRRHPLQHRVRGDRSPLRPAEPTVEVAQHRELARGGVGEVARAEDEAAVGEEEHAPRLDGALGQGRTAPAYHPLDR